MFEIVLSATAQNDLRANVQWWSEHRSPSEAERWYVSILESIYSLEHMPTRCLLAREAETLGIELHNLWFGLSAKQTHRVLYTVDGNTVNVFRVLSTRQNKFELNPKTGD